jgi:GNAT superfamily N-acetyltransferase
MIKNTTSSRLQIIPCSIENAKTVSDVAIRSYKDFYLHLWHDNGDWYIDHSFSQSVFEKEIQDRNHAFFLLKEKENTVGFLKLNIDELLKGYEQYNCIELERIYLIKSATGKGYGRQAMEFCFDYAKKLQKEIIWLKAMDTSSAVLFYELLGFKHCDNLCLDFSQMKEEFRRMVVLMKSLSSKTGHAI